MIRIWNRFQIVKKVNYIAIICLFIGIAACTAAEDSSEEADDMAIGAVAEYGRLKVAGNQLLSSVDSQQVSLYGMSLFWSQWAPDYYNDSCISWLVEDWNISIIRAAVAVDHGGYLTDPQAELIKLDRVVKSAVKNGIYVIIDWHSHHAEDYPEAAEQFFSHAASQYGHLPNVIYEIYNEPLDIDWSSVLKPYQERIINVIRAKDADNLIIAGTPNWSQDVDKAALDPIDDVNIAYAMHFYTGTHGQWLRDRTAAAMERGIAVFVTEMGISQADAQGEIDYVSTQRWLEFCDEMGLSWCNWSVNDKDETTSILLPGGSSTGHWNDNDLSEAGRYMRQQIRVRNSANF